MTVARVRHLEKGLPFIIFLLDEQLDYEVNGVNDSLLDDISRVVENIVALVFEIFERGLQRIYGSRGSQPSPSVSIHRCNLLRRSSNCLSDRSSISVVLLLCFSITFDRILCFYSLDKIS